MSTLAVSAETHCGAVRTHNEDALLSRPELGLFVVADGAGGHDAGEVASNAIVAALHAMPPDLAAADALGFVRRSVSGVHAALHRHAAARGPGTIIASTIVVLLIREAHFVCLWAGDSRAYLLRDDVLTQVTRDHSLVQELVAAGVIAEAEAEQHPHANVITRAVGAAGDDLELDKVSGTLLPGDRFLLCSDGLCKTLDLSALHDKLRAPLSEAAAGLVAEALARQARDNVTALVVGG